MAFHHPGAGLPIEPRDVDAVHLGSGFDREPIVFIIERVQPFDLPAQMIVFPLQGLFEFLELCFDRLNLLPQRGGFDQRVDFPIGALLPFFQQNGELAPFGPKGVERLLQMFFFFFHGTLQPYE